MHRVTLRNHYLLIKQNLLSIVLYLVIITIALLAQFKGSELFIIFMALGFSPVIILHYTYYMQAKDMQIEFTTDGMKVFQGETLQIIKDEDIVRIDLYMSVSMYETGYASGRLLSEEYYYAIIVTNSGEIIINNLLYPDLLNIDRYLNLSKFKYHTKLFAFLP